MGARSSPPSPHALISASRGWFPLCKRMESINRVLYYSPASATAAGRERGGLRTGTGAGAARWGRGAPCRRERLPAGAA